MVLLVRLNYSEKRVNVVLKPKLLKYTGVVVITREHMSLRYELFAWVVLQHVIDPL